MAEDKEVLREIWEGRIAVCFNLSPDEVNTVEQPDPYYLLVPRVSYFPLVNDKVTRHFHRAVNHGDDDELWLEYEGQPLKWHYPIGLLFDLYAYNSPLPWNLTVHFKKFPENEVLHCQGRETVEAYFMSRLKEADSLKHRSHVMNSMQKKDHKQLWVGLNNDKFDQFWSVNRRLMEKVNGETFRNIPLRIYVHDRPCLQLQVKSVSDSGDLVLLLDLLKQAAPQVLDADGSLLPQWYVVVQGIEPPLDTPLQWMSEHLSYPDNFIHMCLVNS